MLFGRWLKRREKTFEEIKIKEIHDAYKEALIGEAIKRSDFKNLQDDVRKIKTMLYKAGYGKDLDGSWGSFK